MSSRYQTIERLCGLGAGLYGVAWLWWAFFLPFCGTLHPTCMNSPLTGNSLPYPALWLGYQDFIVFGTLILAVSLAVIADSVRGWWSVRVLLWLFTLALVLIALLDPVVFVSLLPTLLLDLCAAFIALRRFTGTPAPWRRESEARPMRME